MIALEIAVVALIILLNGFFAMSELAILSSRRPRLQQLAANGDQRARIALTLVDDSSRFLAVVQIGMTLTAIFAGTFSGATLADRLGDWLNTFEPLAHYGKSVAIVLVVVPVSYFSLLLGELVAQAARADERGVDCTARRAAARDHRANRLAFRMAPGRLGENRASPFGVRPVPVRQVTEEEIRSVIAAGAESGAIRAAEREMIEEMLFLADRRARRS